MGHFYQNKQIEKSQSVRIRLLNHFIAISVVPIILCGFCMIFLFQAMTFNTYETTVKKETKEKVVLGNRNLPHTIDWANYKSKE